MREGVGTLSGGLIIMDKVARHIRSPNINGIHRLVIGRTPIAINWNIVDVARIFAIASPGVTHIMEVI